MGGRSKKGILFDGCWDESQLTHSQHVIKGLIAGLLPFPHHWRPPR
ncbi:hypothetical protein RBSWK_04872 [Rhodopirellula baltica SWK14]|uniref:Uncharacterized protein n=1 Tax=Rhodopirellula baltica SWK14 TaxID=993516 RepID=L7CAA9_RHOBT|nr:hypothetical protein RBSWK_04872 [Rhodopirellula baltica SWK14]